MSAALPGFAGRAGLWARLAFLQARWDPATRQAAGFSFAVDPVLRRAWSADPDGLRRARARNLEHFNAHPAAAWLIAGAVSRAEAEAAGAEPAGRAAAEERARRIRATLAPALSGPYDAFFWGALLPAAAALALVAALATHRRLPAAAPAVGAALLLAAHALPALAARAWGLSRGLAAAEGAALELAALPLPAWTAALKRGAAGGLLIAAFLAATDPFLPSSERAGAALALGAGAILSWFEVPGPVQLGAAALVGAAAGFLGVWP